MHAPTSPPLRHARRVGVHEDVDPVVLLLEVDGRDVPVEVPLSPRETRSLRLLTALHEHDPRPHARRVRHVDLLVRALETCGWRARVVVRPGPNPAFWLRMVRGREARELDVTPLDAIVMLLSRRVPVLVTADHDPWPEALERLGQSSLT